MSHAQRISSDPQACAAVAGAGCVLILCFDFSTTNLAKQPWYTVDGIARGLSAHGQRVVVVTDTSEAPQDLPYAVHCLDRRRASLIRIGPNQLGRLVQAFGAELVFAVVGLSELARLPRLAVPVPVYALVASPRLHVRELLDVPLRAWLHEWRLLVRPAINALLPAWLMRRRVVRSGLAGLVWLGSESRARLVAQGLPSGPLVRPSVRPLSLPPPTQKLWPTLGFFGPPLWLRGLDLVLDVFEALRRRGVMLRLRLVLRPLAEEPPSWLKRRLARSPFASDIEVLHAQLAPDALARALAEIDLFLLPFRIAVAEAPLVVPEAALSGRPVIVLDRAGIGSWARRLGAITVAKPTQLADAVVNALAAPLRITPAPWSDWRATTLDLLPTRIQAPNPFWRLRLIALCGVDGSGKTTLARALKRRLARRGLPVRYVWSRYRNYLSKPLLGLMRLCGLSRLRIHNGRARRERDFRRLPGLALLFLGLQVADQVLEIRLRLRRNGIVVADRCLYDTLVDLAVETGSPKLVFERIGPLLERLLPQPRAVFVLEREVQDILRARPDVAIDPHFEPRRRLYEEVAQRFGLIRLPITGTVPQLLSVIEKEIARCLQEKLEVCQ